MKLNRSPVVFALLSWTLLTSVSAQEMNKDTPNKTRQKRQLGTGIHSAVRDMYWRLNNIGLKIDNYVLPKVHYAAEKIRHDVAPSIAKTVKDLTNRVVIKAAEHLQKGAQYLSQEVAPVIEDKVVEISNAAVPVVNKGIDVVGTGLQVGVDAVSKSTSNGIEQIGQKVLGEQRHTRIKKIANNISVNFNNSINNLAGKIKKVTEDDEYIDQELGFVDISAPSDVYTQYKHGYPPNFIPSATNPTHPFYNSHPVASTNKGSTHEKTSTNTEDNMTMPQALRQLVSNTAYTISKQLLGPNLTEAVAPIARSVSNVIGSNLPPISSDNYVQEISNESPESIRSCTTPEGKKGFCQDLQDCPNLVLKFSVLRRSVCFKRLFSPGVCCPDVGQKKKIRDAAVASQSSQTARPTVYHPNAGQTYVQRPGLPVLPQTLAQQGFGSPYFVHPNQQLIHTNLYQQPQHQGIVAQSPQAAVTTKPLHTNGKILRDNIIVNRQFRNNEYACGVTRVPQFRVVGGEESYIGEWPWTAAIYLHGKKKTEFWCGGSLISEQFVLTAAHCTKDSNEKTFDPAQFSVHLGDYNIFNEDDDDTSKPEVFGVRYIIPHPDFKRHGYFNDVAIIKLSRTVEFSPYILPVCLPPESIERSHIDALVGQKTSVIGYGSTHYDGPQSNALRDVQLPIWKNSDCDKAYFQPITNIFICAGYVEGGKDACQGDSGGPMMLYHQGRWIQLGIVSFGNRCAEPGYPGVYTRITHFLPWIRQNMR